MHARDTAFALLILLASGLGSGCASPGGGFAARFVTSGTPAIDLGGPPPAPAARRSGPTQQPRLVARSSSGAGTLEATSPRLREALAALEATPSISGYLAVAAAYRAHHVDDRAFDFLADGLVHFPRAAALHDATARMWRDWGLPDRALRHAHLAVRYAPTAAASHNTLGTVLWALDDHQGAAAAFAAAVKLDSTAGYALDNVCLAARDLGRPRPFSCDTRTPRPSARPPS